MTARTELGQRLLELREQTRANGGRLLDWDGIEAYREEGDTMNLLANGDFTGGQYVWQNKSTVKLPEGWTLFGYSEDGHMPECYVMDMGAPQNIGRIWKAFTSYAKHEYALGQRVRVPVGALLNASAEVWAWSSGKDNPLKSENGGSYHTRIGIDPFGGIDWRSEDIIWSAPPLGHKVMDMLHEICTATVAEAGVVTVWLHGQHEWALKHGDCYWHQAVLEQVGGAPPVIGDDLEVRVARIEDFLAQWTQYQR